MEKIRTFNCRTSYLDDQLWKIGILFFGLNSSLFYILQIAPTIHFLADSLSIIKPLLPIGGVTANILWILGINKILGYQHARIKQIEEIESLNKNQLNIYTEGKKYFAKNWSVKSIYAKIVPPVTLICWLIIFGLIIIADHKVFLF